MNAAEVASAVTTIATLIGAGMFAGSIRTELRYMNRRLESIERMFRLVPREGWTGPETSKRGRHRG